VIADPEGAVAKVYRQIAERVIERLDQESDMAGRKAPEIVIE
jgi:hypothetical protein